MDWTSIKIKNIKRVSPLNSDEFNLIWRLLSESKTRFSLEHLKVWVQTIPELLKIIYLWSKCINLNTLKLNYRTEINQDDRKKVKEALSVLTTKIWILSELVVGNML